MDLNLSDRQTADGFHFGSFYFLIAGSLFIWRELNQLSALHQ